MKIKVILISLLLLTQAGRISGQSTQTSDSLRFLLSDHPQQDTARVNLLLALAKASIPVNLDTAAHYYTKSLESALALDYPDGQINSMNGLGVCYWYTNNARAAVHSFKQALKLAQEVKNDGLVTKAAGNLGSFYNVLGISDSAEYYQRIAVNAGVHIKDQTIYAKALGDLGMVYYNKGNYLLAIEQYMKAKEILEMTKAYRDLTSIYIKIGMLYYDFNDFAKCIAAYREAWKTNRLHKEKGFDAEILQNMGLAYYDLKKDFDSATILLKQAMITGKKQNRKEVEITAFANLGNIQMMKKDYAKSVYYLMNALNSPVIHSRNKLKAAVLTNLGWAYFKLGAVQKALQFTHEGLALSEKQGFIAFQREACKTLSEIAAFNKDYKSAWEYANRYGRLNDSLGDAAIRRKVDEVIFRNSILQKEKENLLLQTDNQIKHQTIKSQRIYLVTFIVIILLGGIILFNRIRTGRKLALLNKDLDLKNKDLQELNQLKAKLYSIIAHDLKSPFTGLLGILSELDEHYDQYDEASKRSMIGSLKRSSHNTYNLLVNLLDWTRLQKGQITVNPSTFRLKEVTDEVASLLGSRVIAKQQTLLTDIGDSEAYTDKEILKSILLNLTNNAIKFSHEGSTIHLRAESRGDHFYFEVQDTGVGIPPEELHNLFKLEMKFQRKGTAKEPGTGLGLIMSKEFVQLLGGTIGADSRVDQGSRFYFTVPRRNSSDQN